MEAAAPKLTFKRKCSTTDAEWEEHQKTRQLEIEACSKALAVLSSDEAHDLFTKTFAGQVLKVVHPRLLSQKQQYQSNDIIAVLEGLKDEFLQNKKDLDESGRQTFL